MFSLFLLHRRDYKSVLCDLCKYCTQNLNLKDAKKKKKKRDPTRLIIAYFDTT